ncbi:MAG: LuxR C-terminal-related transcriptional regulator [Thermoflexales bacterium]
MPAPILATKLFIPPPRPKTVLRPRLINRLNEGMHRKLTLISTPAGFGKTTLVSEWLASCARPAAWLSLDEGDNDPNRFLTYLVAALQTIAAHIGEGVLGVLQSPQPPPTESILSALLNEITTELDEFVLVLDDYHAIDAKPVDIALAFLLEHLPPQMHLVISTREDPDLPLARLRARSQLTELRATDLRFTAVESADFLNPVMGLQLSADDIAALENRTEGWIVGLQLAAISLQGQKDTTEFIQSFTGSHRFVLDYLVEEVLHQQSERVQTFLLRTSILDRLCGSLCDAVLQGDADLHPTPSASGQETLEYLDRANLFIVPLDNDRRWFRYHHLFADLLRQRLQQLFQSAPSSAGNGLNGVSRYHTRASQWYEDNNLGIEAFRHAVAANDVERAERLIKGIPVHFRGAVTTVLDWLSSLPTAVLDARPSLWLKHASLLLVTGQSSGVEEKLQAAESSLKGRETDEQTRNFIGQIAAARATLALSRYQAETMITQSRRALEYLHPANTLRANANWTLGIAYLYKGDRVAARRALAEAITLSQAAGDIFTTILATIGLGMVQESENQFHQATETYLRGLQLAGDPPLPIASEAHLGLARILCEWNDLDAAEQHGRRSLQLARQYDRVIDRFLICEVFLARLKLVAGDVTGASAILAQASQSAHQHNFLYRIPEVASAQVLTLLRQGHVDAAAVLAQRYELPISQARVHLAQGDPSAALTLLGHLRQQVEAKSWADERLKVMVLQVVAHHAHGEKDKALQVLGDALTLAETGGFIRTFVDEGIPMAHLLSETSARGIMPDYVGKLLAVFETEAQNRADPSFPPPDQPLIEALSQRELEVLQLIAEGLSNQEIGGRLSLTLSTVKGHNLKIFSKLQVQRRTEAVARARALGLLNPPRQVARKAA